MDLQYHLSIILGLSQRGVNPDHGDLDQVGRRALQRGIARRALAECPDAEIAVPDLGDVAPPPEQRLDEAFVAGLLDRAVEPGPHAGEALEVLLDESLRLLESDAQLARQRERALPVDRREVDRLGAAAHLAGDLRFRHPENHSRRLTVDITTALECGNE